MIAASVIGAAMLSGGLAWLDMRGAAAPASGWRAAQSATLGPLLDDARRRGVLTVEVRAYRRPAPPGVRPELEPDGYDAEMARYLAARLGVEARLVWRDPERPPAFAANLAANLAASAAANAGAGRAADSPIASQPPDGQADLVLAGALPPWTANPWGGGAAQLAMPYIGGAGALVVLRGSAIATADQLAGKPVCVAHGSPYAAPAAARHRAVLRTYPSAIHAIAGFMAGECLALAEDRLVLDRMLGTADWRFYRLLGTPLPPDQATVQIVLREVHPATSAWLARAVRQWSADGSLAQARVRRAAALNFEAAQLQSGSVCHS